jgi:hypothetical protein
MGKGGCHVKGLHAAYAEHGNPFVTPFLRGQGAALIRFLHFRADTMRKNRARRSVRKYVAQPEPRSPQMPATAAEHLGLWGVINQFVGVSFLR